MLMPTLVVILNYGNMLLRVLTAVYDYIVI